MYLPIPEGVNASDSVTVSRPTLDCGGTAMSSTVTVNFSVPKSSVSLEKKNDSILYEIYRPTDGQWSKVKESGSIKMTPMSIKNERTIYHIGQVDVPYIAWKHARMSHVSVRLNGVCTTCGGVAWHDQKAAIVKGSYVEQGDLDYWKSKYPDAAHYKCGVKYLDQNKLEAAKSEALAELYQGYNLGEEIAELRETILGVTKLLKEGISMILKFRSTINSLLRKGKTAEASSRWMEFRYGIMPILYSVQDLLELNSEGKYLTTRRTVYPEVEMDESELGETPYFETVGFHELRATITSKAKWASSGLKNLDRVNMNLLTTTTAVLPWSMVIRWFFNVQSYLDVKVKSLTTLAQEERCCIAIREKKELGTYLCVTTGYQNQHIVDDGYSSLCGYIYPVTDFGTFTDLRPQRVLLSMETVDNYNRYLFNSSDVKMVFNPYISWQRAVDSLIMAMRPLSKLLRRLK